MDGDMDAAARVILGVDESARVAVRPRFAKTRILGNAPRGGRTGCAKRDGGRASRVVGVASCSFARPRGVRHNPAATPCAGQGAGLALRLRYRQQADDGEHGRECPILFTFPKLCIAGDHEILLNMIFPGNRYPRNAELASPLLPRNSVRTIRGREATGSLYPLHPFRKTGRRACLATEEHPAALPCMVPRRGGDGLWPGPPYAPPDARFLSRPSLCFSLHAETV